MLLIWIWMGSLLIPLSNGHGYLVSGGKAEFGLFFAFLFFSSLLIQMSQIRFSSSLRSELRYVANLPFVRLSVISIRPLIHLT